MRECWLLSTAARRVGVRCGEVLSAFLFFLYMLRWVWDDLKNVYIHYIYFIRVDGGLA